MVQNITLINRNFGTIPSKDEFISFIMDDFKSAQAKYLELVTPKMTAYHAKRYAAELARITKRATEYAESHWKTEKRRTKYVEEEIEAFRNRFGTAKVEEIDFFDFDPAQGTTIYRPSTACITKESTDAQLTDLYNTLLKSKYFNKSKGWKFTYITIKETCVYSFRPSIEIILDEADKHELEIAKERHEDSVSAFYEDATYCGD